MIKILIADDEDLIRNGLAMMITKYSAQYNICGLAEDGSQAVELIQAESPDIVITDIKMPVMDGIELINWLNKYCPRTEHIVLSGFNDVELVRACLRLHTSDYLLKPVNKTELFAILDKLAGRIAEKRESTNHNVLLNKAYNMACEAFYNKIITKPYQNRKQIYDFLNEYKICFNDTSIEVIIISADFSKKIWDDINKLNYAIRNISEEILDNSEIKVISFYTELNEIVFIVENSNRKADESVILAKTIKETIEKTIGQSITIGISKVYSGLENTHKAYSEAQFAISSRILHGHGKVWHFNSITNENKSFKEHLGESKKLISYIESLNKEKAIKVIDKLFNQIFKESNISPAYVYEFLNDYFSRINLMMKEEKIFLDDELKEYIEKNSQCYDSMEQIKTCILKMIDLIIERLLNNRRVNINKIVYNAKSYIEKEYYNNITLNSIAEYLHISPNYFCEQFKKETGLSFVDYLTFIRIENAKKLLLEKDLNSYDICIMVGYDNPTYFSKVFKRVTGLTPSQYRNII